MHRAFAVLMAVVCFAVGDVVNADDDTAASNQTLPTSESADWPQFRGPRGEGHAAQRGVPLKWSSRKNVVWKTPIPGNGWSSPVIKDGKLWLTTATKRNRSLRVLCVDCESGDLLTDVEVFQRKNPGKIHPKNTHATPTLVLESDRVYAHFGAHGAACLSADGTVVWKTQTDYYHHHGPAGSPIVLDDLLIYSCDGFDRPFYDRLIHRGVEEYQFVVAIEKNSGKIRWRSPREGRHSYSTPLAIDVDGTTQVISVGGDRVVAYDPGAGEEIWSCRYDGYSVVPRPVFGHGMVFVCTGFDSPRLLAIRANGRGDVTKSHVEWTAHQNVPLTPSPLLVGEELYLVSDTGIVSCLNAKTGHRHWRHRLGGKFSASPLYVDGRIYLLAENGLTHVLEPGKKYNKLTSNALKGRTLASIAVWNRSLFIRTNRSLYRIEEKGEE